MVQRMGGFRRKSRKKLRKAYKEKGKTPLRKHLQSFDVGDKVVLTAEPSVQGGIYDLKFHGKIAEVTGKQGACYNVQVQDGGKSKILIVNPVHLKKVRS
ncbi:50S ribosomal protein L21e [Nanoarchaeota archaeon]